MISCSRSVCFFWYSCLSRVRRSRIISKVPATAWGEEANTLRTNSIKRCFCPWGREYLSSDFRNSDTLKYRSCSCSEGVKGRVIRRRSVNLTYSKTCLRRVRQQKLCSLGRKSFRSAPAFIYWLRKEGRSPKMFSSIRVEIPYSSVKEFCRGVAVKRIFLMPSVAQRMRWPILLLGL